MNKSEENKKIRICVSILGPLGDVVNTSSVFRQLRKHYPDSEISIITTSVGKIASMGIKEIDKRFVFEKKMPNPLVYMYQFSKNFKSYDIYIVLDNSFRSAFLSFLSGAKLRIGRKGQFKEFLLTKTIDYLKEEIDEQIPVYEHYYRCLKPLGIYDDNNMPSFDYSEEDKDAVKTIFEKECKSDKPKLAMCLFAKDFEKSIEMEDAIEIVNKLKDKYELILIGGDDISDRANELSQKTENAFVNLAGKTTFLQTACAIDNCSKFISVDTSPLHLAIAQKTPTLAIFFTHIYKKWGPQDLDFNKLILNRQNKKISAEEVLDLINSMKPKQFEIA